MRVARKGKAKRERKKGFRYLLVLLILGALIGTIVGEVIGIFFKEGTMVHKVFVRAINIGIGPESPLNLYAVTLALTIKLNLCSAFGMLLCAYIYKYF